MTCGARPKVVGRHRCVVCLDKIAPIGEREKESARRLAMVPEPLRKKTVPKRLWPAGQRWCSGCQSFRDLDDVRGSRCIPCASMASHSAMVKKTYGIDRTSYDALFDLQGGRCAICGNRPGKKKRLAVDHSHDTGEVRGLLCGRCNHDLLGAGFDSKARIWSAYVYLDTPPAGGSWDPIAEQRLPDRVRPAEDSSFVTPSASSKGAPVIDDDAACARPHYIPAGAVRNAEGTQWRVYVGPDDPPPF